MNDAMPDRMRAALDEWRARLDDPWLVASWPGMGGVARLAAMHLMRQLGARTIVELPGEPMELPAVEVERGLIQPLRLHGTSLWGWKNPTGGRDLVFYDSDVQPRQSPYRSGQHLVEAALALGVVRVCTFAAMATMIDPKDAPRVFAAASGNAPLDEVLRLDAVPVVNGSIGGLNGVLIGIAALRGLDGLCLLGEMPYFAAGIANPKAAAAVLRLFARLTGIEIDVAQLDADAARVEAQLHDLHERAQRGAAALESLQAPVEASDDVDVGDREVGEREVAPEERRTRARIERMFAAARRDRSQALKLKAELDRHGLFADYEDRFLDLFKRAD